jgi:hypothetical protein
MGEPLSHWNRDFVLPVITLIPWSHIFEKPVFLGAVDSIGQPDYFHASEYGSSKDFYGRPITRLSIYVEFPWLFFVAMVIAPIVMLLRKEES